MVTEIHIVLIGILANIPVGYFAHRKQTLTMPWGILLAGLLGFVLIIAHVTYWVVLLTFFTSSILLTRYKEDDSIKQTAMSLAEKTGKRDALQVFANGGIPLLLGLYIVLTAGLWQADPVSLPSVSIAIAFAVVTADTWATELGVLSSREPYWIRNLTKTVPRGSSGGVSPLGIMASLGGGLLIGMVYVLPFATRVPLYMIVVIMTAGLVGSLVDSFLGATLQAQYYCSSCEKITEQDFHQSCGTGTTYHSGLTWFGNDVVNILSVIVVLILFLPFLG